MRFVQTPLKGAYRIEPELASDERGFFARSFCVEEFANHGLNTKLVQCNISFNHVRGTLRGMHFQLAPHEEAKLVRCTRGAVYDVIIDLRRDSETFCGWHAVNLSSENRTALYVPEGFAHGFVTLEDNTEVYYQMCELYHPGAASGIRWNDPAIGIDWPVEVSVISERDRNFPDLKL